MDLEMPDSDCWEVVRRLKKDAQTGHIPIIGMSAYARTTSARKPLPPAATSSMPNRSTSNLWSPPFGDSSRTRNNSFPVLVRTARRPASAR
jgi:CheY-like chemotaxis protein